jgi:hypothetical protein
MLLEFIGFSVLLCPHVVGIQLLRAPIPAAAVPIQAIYALSGCQEFIEVQWLEGGIGLFYQRIAEHINPNMDIG